MTVMMSAMNNPNLFGAGTVPAALALVPRWQRRGAPNVPRCTGDGSTRFDEEEGISGCHSGLRAPRTETAQAARIWRAILRTCWMKLSLAPAMRIERNAMHRRAVKREVLASGT